MRLLTMTAAAFTGSGRRSTIVIAAVFALAGPPNRTFF
jgi:hypothetical protein